MVLKSKSYELRPYYAPSEFALQKQQLNTTKSMNYESKAVIVEEKKLTLCQEKILKNRELRQLALKSEQNSNCLNVLTLY